MKEVAMRHGNYEKLMELLAKEHSCFILITCDNKSSDGNMNVNMTYEGDPALASYLLDGAKARVDAEIEAEVSESKDFLRVVK
jgi:hypothetical protein